MEVDDAFPISALEHLMYCERQCALIHIDGVWIENAHTTAGRHLHERVDSGEQTARPGVRVLRSLHLRSRALGLYGIADVVEMRREGKREVPYPVEYKRGARKRWLHDEVQLAAQAMALEEMMGVPVPEGAIFYGKSERRRVVAIDDALRAQTVAAAQRLRAMIEGGIVPAPRLDARCKECSLRGACLPEAPGAGRSLAQAFRKHEDE